MRPYVLVPALALALFPALAWAAPAPLRPGEPLPPLAGLYLTGRPAELPGVAHGRVALVAMGFTYESRHAVEAWVERFRAAFGRDSLVTFYEVPMYGGLARMARPFIDSGMRRATPRELHENVITVSGATGAWKPRVRFADPDVAYLTLLDAEGRVRWLHAGRVGEASWTELERAVREARAIAR